MIRTINLFSLISIKDDEIIQKSLNILSTKFHPLEIETINSLCCELTKNAAEISDCNDFYIGFEIPQISKEFDLLRIGKEKIINIELKSIFTSVEKIQYQLKRNNYYLKFLEKEILLFTYCAKEKKLFLLTQNGNLEEAEFAKLIEDLRTQKDIFTGNLAGLFNPSDYLVSPFNSTDKFLNTEYFLTSHLEVIEKEIMAKIDERKSSIISIKGKAGTGKSLLLYHIARKLREENEKVLIVHGGILNSGHKELIEKGWEIISSLDLDENYRINSRFSVVLVDETQRMSEEQFDKVVNFAKENNSLCVFSHDKNQTLFGGEIHSHIYDFLKKHSDLRFELTNKIRTNKEINDFIYAILGKNQKQIPLSENANIVYFEDENSAAKYINSRIGWSYITYKNTNELETNVVGTIGQEFDNVIAVIDSSFYYDEFGELAGPKLNMFVQAITRVRERLEIVIIENLEVYKKMLSFFE